MRPISRRGFLKSFTSSVVGAWVIFQMERAEASEAARRDDLVSGVVRAGTPGVIGDDSAALRFLVIGDWGWAGIKPRPNPSSPTEAEDNRRRGRTEHAVAKAMGEWGAAHSPSFVLSVGDNFYPNGVKSTDDARWGDAYERVFTADSLQVPWWCALGNHDYRGSVQAQIDYSKISKRWRMPARYFTFSEKSSAGVSVQFFVLDTSPFHKGLHRGGHSDVAEQDASAQLAWLERELAASKADWKVLVGHHPLWTGGVRRDMHEQELHRMLPPLMRKHGVKLYFCGHEHDAQHIERDGLHNLLIGNGGDPRPTGVTEGTVFAASAAGFGYATFTKAEARIHFLGTDGAVLHTAVVPELGMP